jgi:hypothetical protein
VAGVAGDDPGEAGYNLPKDDFEVHARAWTAQERILEAVSEVVEEHGLDPRLFEDIRDAYNSGHALGSEEGEQAQDLALARFLEAFREARQEAKEEE